MNLKANDGAKIKIRTQFAWYAILLLVILGYRYLKEIIVFTLTKLYEFFIQQNIVNQ